MHQLLFTIQLLTIANYTRKLKGLKGNNTTWSSINLNCDRRNISGTSVILSYSVTTTQETQPHSGNYYRAFRINCLLVMTGHI